MNEQEFEALAAKTLATLAEAIEDAGGDVELSSGVLTLTTDDGRTFLINKHAPLKQLWYSSPLSGAHHYEAKGGAWISTRDGTPFLAKLKAELGAADIAVELYSPRAPSAEGT
ncbi:MAG: iron donor protein CyaY [Alphaproteobacteria bacterium]|nr:iron donor protein CyaY [Alphaproteobacteria bacterium]